MVNMPLSVSTGKRKFLQIVFMALGSVTFGLFISYLILVTFFHKKAVISQESVNIPSGFTRSLPTEYSVNEFGGNSVIQYSNDVGETINFTIQDNSSDITICSSTTPNAKLTDYYEYSIRNFPACAVTEINTYDGVRTRIYQWSDDKNQLFTITVPKMSVGDHEIFAMANWIIPHFTIIETD